MMVEERVVRAATATEPAWLATRQPAVVRFLGLALGEGSDAHAVALATACAIHGAFEASLGVPPPRVTGSLLARADAAVRREADHGPLRDGDGVVARQPALAELVAQAVGGAPALPLDGDEAAAAATALLAVVYALDEVTTGRPVP